MSLCLKTLYPHFKRESLVLVIFQGGFQCPLCPSDSEISEEDIKKRTKRTKKEDIFCSFLTKTLLFYDF